MPRVKIQIHTHDGAPVRDPAYPTDTVIEILRDLVSIRLIRNMLAICRPEITSSTEIELECIDLPEDIYKKQVLFTVRTSVLTVKDLVMKLVGKRKILGGKIRLRRSGGTYSLLFAGKVRVGDEVVEYEIPVVTISLER